MKIPRVIENLIESFEKLPGIGPKTAQRLTFYLLHVPQSELESFADALTNLKKQTVLCSVCKNVAEADPCSICADPTRDKSTIMVVEQPLDILAIEKTGKYKGLYHALHGAINPLENIGPEELFIDALLKRVGGNQPGSAGIREIIFATNPTMEGEATAMYIRKAMEQLANGTIKQSRLGVGIPTGADIEYADETTITQAIEGRRQY
ncbi:recombination protein RecR [Candidatus Microgenomates bacterium]|nr:recombination protein RecR [Candidatus Microgenomates bacterium]